ncbi:MAG: phosphomannose isomerase type II C-terminal cupin domain [Candidatus Caenarcaniphilales bacterium]|nr:phosphomannose isomerase type II C-terminal cupin domain [Candidatus Caenarcaniphilales bacterium]
METKVQHQTPWGAWEVLDDADSHKVKKVTIKPGHRLSYQKHFKREENWFVVQGKAKVTLDDVEHMLKEGEFIHIPFEALHRIENIDNTVDLIFIEIQRGSYFGEDDIVRVSDDYGRD